MKTRRSFLWVCVVVLALLVAYPIIALCVHWQGVPIGFFLWPITIGLLLIVINRLGSFDYADMNKRDVDSTLKVDYRVRYSLISTMKMKRRTAWLYLVASVALSIGAVAGVLMNGFLVGLLLLAVSGVLGWMWYYTNRNAKAVEKSIKTNNQAVFNEAMAKWKRGYRFTFVVYLLVIIIPILVLVYILINQIPPSFWLS